METFIGRTEEIAILNKVWESPGAELVAVYGRRRVGKTFLIRNVFQEKFVFEFSGIHHATLDEQLESFILTLSKLAGTPPLAKPANWLQAFSLLTDFLNPFISKKKAVVFFDEFPWINTPRSGFLPAFENFWNTWASKQDKLIVVICGSAASWMIQRVIHNRGGLHNRVTRKIRLMPFTLAETELFLRSRNVNLDRYQILQIYMIFGGVPHYLKEIEVGESAVQAIDRICFTKDGLLQSEFTNLFYSLFSNAGYHMDIIRALASKNKGLTRGEIIAQCKFKSGGAISQLLDDLTESGFISPYVPFQKTAKDMIYRLSDEYSNFYIQFVENRRSEGSGTWISLSAGASWKSWSGYAFEGICMKHTPSLKKALGIQGVYTETSVWRCIASDNQPGTQIDLLIDRQDRCINIFEIKFSTGKFEITKSYARELEQKLMIFRARTKTTKTLFLTMVTTYGIQNSDKYPGLLQQELSMDILFI